MKQIKNKLKVSKLCTGCSFSKSQVLASSSTKYETRFYQILHVESMSNPCGKHKIDLGLEFKSPPGKVFFFAHRT